jgi:hypothetical protein
MKLDEIAKLTFEIAKNYETNNNINLVRNKLISVSEKVKDEKNILGSCSYSIIDPEQPLMAIFYENKKCLSFSYNNDKLYVNYNGRMKSVKPVKKLQTIMMETPAIKVEFAPAKLPDNPLIGECNCSDCKKKKKK